MKETGKPVSREERPVQGGDETRNRPSEVQPSGLAEVLAGMIISALSWEDTHDIQADKEKNDKHDKDVTGSRCIMFTPV